MSTAWVSSRICGPRVRYALGLALAVALFATDAGLARAAGAPAGLPGPPPEAGTGIPLPPPPGQDPPPQPFGSAATLPLNPSGPGLLSGSAGLTGGRLKLNIACTAGGQAALSVPDLATGTVARAKYKCVGGRSTVSLSLGKTIARKVNGSGSVLAHVAFRQGGGSETQSVMVGPHPPAAQFWTSVFGLQCTAFGGELTAPNFTVTPTTTIDVRPWLAWYTPATGWQWLGTDGPNSSRWYRWVGTPGGVAEWQTPSGTLNPWTWGPITVSPGHGTYVIAVLEAVYWYSHPVYVWEYAHSYPSSPYCAYP
jgi:hypothetical protein